ncbi:MAG TPA: nuclear transport factor 2 family protein [Polyangiaceae bacterium]
MMLSRGPRAVACAISLGAFTSCATTVQPRPGAPRAAHESESALVEQVLREFDAAWARNDLEGVVGTFAPDATLESPLVVRLLNRKEGVLRGRSEIREMVSALMKRGTPWARHTAIGGSCGAVPASSDAQ